VEAMDRRNDQGLQRGAEERGEDGVNCAAVGGMES